ncbi:MAG TPA: Yip1 family protein [Longimicrobiales bacterium]
MNADVEQAAQKEERADADRRAKVARWEDCIDVFFSPAELFRRRAQDRVGPPLVTLLVVAIAVHFALMPANAMVMRAAVAGNPRAAEALGSFGTLMQVLGAAFVPIGYLISITAVAALLWVGGRMAGVEPGFSRTMLIATYAAFTRPLAEVATALLVVLHGEAGLDVVRHGSLGVLRFVGDRGMDPVLVPLLGRLEVFAIWQAILWAAGVVIICGASRLRAAAIAMVAWALAAVPGVVGALLGAAAGR